MCEQKNGSEFLREEYIRVKTEQIQRIGFRDNMLFVQLITVGGVASFVLNNIDKQGIVHSLHVIPWVCIVIGWTYVVNDHAISRIGRYIREVLEVRASKLAELEAVRVKGGDGDGFDVCGIFGWEPYHRIDKRRLDRKFYQFMVDILTFVAPGLSAIFIYCYLLKSDVFSPLPIAALVIEVFILVWLAIQIHQYSDFDRGA